MEKINIYINDVDVKQDINIRYIMYTDSFDGYTADSIEIQCSNTEDDWQKWDLKINSTIKIIYGQLDTGILYVDDLQLIDGGFIIYAKSIPLDAKSNNLQAWESINLNTIFDEKCKKYNFDFEKYDIENHQYKRIEQAGEKDLAFLSKIANLEGYSIKAYNNKIILINDDYFLKAQPQKVISRYDVLNDYNFVTSQNGILQEIVFNTKFGKISYKDDTLKGDKKEIYNKYISSYAEGLRFAKGYLQKNNFDYLTCDIMIQGDFELSAGLNVELTDFDEYDGLYMIKKITSRIDDNFFMLLSLRRIL